ncbi:MAG TPA: hypothetical protein VHZ07_01885 [Bryobacteraceae bacterium]|jgi:hypothetical protein|nr:hypothetical protein [Bryobacteraceae bacterium]
MWATIPSATIIRPGTTFQANPNPIVVSTTPRVGATTLIWHAPVAKVEIHVGSPDGRLFVEGGSDGHATTGRSVTNNTIFYLQDATATKPTGRDAMLAILPVAVR